MMKERNQPDTRRLELEWIQLLKVKNRSSKSQNQLTERSHPKSPIWRTLNRETLNSV